MVLRSRARLLSVILSLVFIVTLLPWYTTSISLAQDKGLLNPGFEDVVSGDIPVHWGIEAGDYAGVIDTDGPFDFPYTTIDPYRGSYKLRLGTPKPLSEKQERSDNTVEQTFTPNGNTILLSFRILSWEHRGNDIVRIDLKDPAGSHDIPVGTISFDDNNPEYDFATDTRLISTENNTVLWEVTINNDKRGDFLDTGWIEGAITWLGNYDELTLSYTVGGTNNSAHATWAYFDSVNTRPVAKFSFSPSEEPDEGDILEFIDLSYDPDGPRDEIDTWKWEALNEDNEWIEFSDSRHPYIIPHDEGTYEVRLTVTDTYGATDMVVSGTQASDGDDVPPLIIYNAPPKVNALNIEVSAGEQATLIGRFADPGWLDTHSVDWSLPDGITFVEPPEETFEEDNFAFLCSGISTVRISVGENVTGILEGIFTVQDNDGGTASDTFYVTVITDDPDNRENNNTIDEAKLQDPLEGDGIYLSYIQSQGDVDIFEVVHNDATLPLGSELLVTLSGMAADYDLLILAETQLGGQTAPLRISSFQASPLRISPLRISPLRISPLRISPLRISEYQRSPLRISPLRISPLRISPLRISPLRISPFNQYPLSEIGYTGLDGDDIGGTDISLAEIGLGDIGTGFEVTGFSANRGLTPEVLLTRSEFTDTRLFVAVVGANGAYGSEPYSLQIEISEPLDMVAAIQGTNPDYPDLDALFKYDVPVDDWTQPTSTVPLHTYEEPDPNDPKGALTLFVTQRERIQGRYMLDENDLLDEQAWNNFIGQITLLAQHPDVRGNVISLPLDIYEGWDTDPDSIVAVNQLTEDIKAEIQSFLTPDIEYVVFLGNDDIIPNRRVPDETIISNERYYLLDSFLKPGSPLYASIMEGYNLTDDYYVDEVPTDWQGRFLYVPDVAISRLVETPEEIEAAAIAFLNSNGILEPDTALVTGYDFFFDGSQAVADALPNGITVNNDLIHDPSANPPLVPWTAEQLRSLFLYGQYGIDTINAHFTHYAALSAYGFVNEVFDDILGSDEVSNLDGDLLEYSFILSMGCHAGLNVPDEAVPAAEDLGLGIDPALDFAQAMAQQRAIYVASTGYGLGDDEGIGGTERLMVVLAEELFTEDIVIGSINYGKSAGSALMEAKHRYLSSLSAMTVYDEKSSVQFTLYGLPQYRVDLTGIGTESLEDVLMMISTEIGTLELTIDGNTTYHALAEVSTDSGVYFTADGDAQATVGRAIQPRVVIDETSEIDPPIHGVLLTYAEFTEEGINPVIARPTNEWEWDAEELQVNFLAFWPSELARVNTFETRGGQLEQTLVVIPGQFRATGTDENGDITGIQRLHNNLTFSLLRPGASADPNDWEPPVISSIDLRTGDDPGTVEATIEASDDSGIIDKIVVLIITRPTEINGETIPGTITSQEFDVSAGTGPYNVTVTGVGGDSQLLVYTFDPTGNGTVATGKGASMTTIPLDAGPDQFYEPGDTIDFDVTLGTSLEAPVFYIWEFGDSTFESGQLTAEELDAGSFFRSHTYTVDSGATLTARLKVTDANGGIGVDTVRLVRIYTDPEGDVADSDIDLSQGDFTGGYVLSDADEVIIGLVMASPVDTGDFQYRIKITTDSGGDYHLKYDSAKGRINGPGSLVVTVTDNILEFRFSRADIGTCTSFTWSAETQSGIPATGTAGIIDNIPDTGTFNYPLP